MKRMILVTLLLLAGCSDIGEPATNSDGDTVNHLGVSLIKGKDGNTYHCITFDSNNYAGGLHCNMVTTTTFG